MNAVTIPLRLSLSQSVPTRARCSGFAWLHFVKEVLHEHCITYIVFGEVCLFGNLGQPPIHTLFLGHVLLALPHVIVGGHIVVIAINEQNVHWWPRPRTRCNSTRSMVQTACRLVRGNHLLHGPHGSLDQCDLCVVQDWFFRAFSVGEVSALTSKWQSWSDGRLHRNAYVPQLCGYLVCQNFGQA